MGIPPHAVAGLRCLSKFEAGVTVDEITEWFDVSKDHVAGILEFAARWS